MRDSGGLSPHEHTVTPRRDTKWKLFLEKVG